MKKNLLIGIILMLFCCATVSSQSKDTTSTKSSLWTKGITTSLNFSQVTFTNWAAGGTNSISLNSFFNTFANYKKGIHNWDNSLQLGYGIIYTKSQPLQKSDDKIILDSKYGIELTKILRASALINAKTQFSNTFEYDESKNAKLVSAFLAPGYISTGIGLDIVPLNWLSINVSPAMAKFTIVTIEDLQRQYGNIDKNDSTVIFKSRFGGMIKVDLKKEVFKNVQIASNLTLFTDYLDDNPFDVAVNWDVFIIMKINKFLSANLATNLIWDENILTTDTNNDGIKDAARVQFKELFGIGITVSF